MTLKESLMTIKDFRIDRCKKHNLCDILMIVLIGYLTGCKDMEEIHFSAEVSEEMLRKYLELPNGIPSTDTILRVLAVSFLNLMFSLSTPTFSTASAWRISTSISFC